MAELSVMDRINMILSDPEKATMTLAQIVSEEIREFKASPEYAIMLEAESYYRNRSDVQRKTIDVANQFKHEDRTPDLEETCRPESELPSVEALDGRHQKTAHTAKH